ncbi:UDP-n-acetylglucosamine transferase subunit [Blastocystis sp. subtype 4]|uniref:UDP-n-acetylglucosamine transferase subunit n=1 Tax=Blastocystis sp. subtype 4 TaxID=944170 RepID=UPI000711A016|nr:UDP-n-acetylglucosamine transferase subunit [Blastocystis sp. subtype 4]KNB46596.1 UDP-n-acetylglucosamine transferase subunit [Blastocystis sp. subtype 4]|eukprot:XP_014530039.1 UDP-n-acetylglucosamine transferase subunit [Blastocystis sp. subtype 4]
MIVLGSDLQFTVGGHTSEMISLIRNLNSSQFAPIVFVHADTDTKSPIYLAESSLDLIYSIRSIPRSREVGQSYFTSIFSTLLALFQSLHLVLEESPSLLILNGPGTCVPIALSVALFRALNILKCRIVFVESFCRVER